MNMQLVLVAGAVGPAPAAFDDDGCRAEDIFERRSRLQRMASSSTLSARPCAMSLSLARSLLENTASGGQKTIGSGCCAARRASSSATSTRKRRPPRRSAPPSSRRLRVVVLEKRANCNEALVRGVTEYRLDEDLKLIAVGLQVHAAASASETASAAAVACR